MLTVLRGERADARRKKDMYLYARLPADDGEIARRRVGRELDHAVECTVVGFCPVEVVLIFFETKRKRRRYMSAHTTNQVPNINVP